MIEMLKRLIITLKIPQQILLFEVMEAGKKRCFSSLNELVTLIASDLGKCVGYQVLTKSCGFCSSWELGKDTEPELSDNFLESHKCPINHTGSGGSMAQQTVSCLPQTQENFVTLITVIPKLSQILKNNAYPGTVVEKLEFVGHIQKRVDNRLHNLRNTMKLHLPMKKSLEGKVA